MKLNNKYNKKRAASSNGEKVDEKVVKRGKFANNELYKPPTVEELNTLRETEVLFNSNLFRLQTEELIRAVFVKQKRKRAVESWIEKFQKLTERLPEYGDNKLSDFNLCLDKTEAPQKLKGILKHIGKSNPLLNLKCDLNAWVKLLRPQSCQIVGLYNVNALIGPCFELTLNVIMPKGCFQDKDYLNARYLVKRSLYLSYIATYLQKENICRKIQYSYLNGNYLVPVICVEPENITNAKITICVTPEQDTFKAARFGPDKNNVRSKYFSACAGYSLHTENALPTLFYNSVVLNDLTLIANEEFNSANVKGLKGVSEGLILLIVWLRQRQLNKGFGAFTEELLYSVVSHLVASGKVNKHMSSYQVIRNVWNYFEQSQWDQETKQLQFLDCTGHYNLAANLDVNIYRRVKHEAQLALLYLNEGKFTSFQTLFMSKLDFYLQFDVLINIEHSNALFDLYTDVEDNLKIDYLTNKFPLIQQHICKTLQTGLSDRISCIVPKLQSQATWNLGAYPPDRSPVCFGVQLNSTNMYKIVDKGPTAYEALATEFRRFWGNKSDLRRFKDGSITEAVYWQAEQIHEKRAISKRIIDFVLRDKLKLQEFSIVYDQFESILKLYKAPAGAVEEGNLKIVQVFDGLAKKLRDLNLPLSISNIQGISQAFCHSDAYPPVATNYFCGKKTTREIRNQIVFKDDINLMISPNFVAPITAILEMVHHSKWPNDASAMRNLRTAFYLQIAEQLTQSTGDDNSAIRTNVCHEYLDILYQGFVFRIVLFHPKEVSLIKKHQDERGIVSFRDTPQSLKLEQDFCVVPRVIGALNGIHSRCPTFGPGTILMKRWLNSQLLDDWHVPAVVVGLLSASLYLDCAPFQWPRLPQLAFIRFLALLVRFPFSVQPLYVNFNEEITREQRDEFETKFQQHRSNFPPLCIVTPFDKKSFFTSNAPSQEILYRITVLAKESLDTIQKNIHSQSLFDCMAFFKPNLQGYNVIIHLQPFLNPTRHENITDNISTLIDRNQIEPYDENINNKMPIVDFHPVQLYLNELRKIYNNFALFFSDSYGGNVICVLWKPNVFQQQDFKISEVQGKKLIEKEKLKANLDAIVEDFHVLGEGIVKNIEIV